MVILGIFSKGKLKWKMMVLWWNPVVVCVCAPHCWRNCHTEACSQCDGMLRCMTSLTCPEVAWTQSHSDSETASYKIKSNNTSIKVIIACSVISGWLPRCDLATPQLRETYIVTVCVFVSYILFWFPQRTHYFWRVFRFLFMKRKQDYNVTSVKKNVKVCF